MKKKTYYKQLDILRVVACIAVLLYHLNILKGGYLAVCSFFVLTGYLSVVSSFNKEKFSLWEYYKSRFLHIYLPLLIVVFTSIVIVTRINDFDVLNLKPETFSVILGYNNFWQINANLDYFARHVDSPFMHLWYIGILLQFELVFPIIFAIFKKIGDKLHKILPCLILIFISILCTALFYYMSIKKPVMVVYYNTLARMFSIWFGVFLGFVTHYYDHLIPKVFQKRIIKTIILIAYFALLIVLLFLGNAESKYFALIMILVTLMTVRMIDYATIESKENINAFDKLMKYIAGISYEVYLFQYPVIFIFQYITLSKYVKVPLIIVITVVLSLLLHYALSKSEHLKGLKYILRVLFAVLSIYGIYIFATTKDYTREMQELQEQLAENEKLMNQQKEEYAAKMKEQEENWALELADFEEGEAKIAEKVLQLPVIFVGDSVMLGALPNLLDKFPNSYGDAQISRTDYVVNDILLELKEKNMLGGPIILNFGANGDCRNNKCKENIMKTVGDRDVFWLTVTNDKKVHFNDRIKDFAKNYDNLHIIDWETISSGHSEYFGHDGIHLTGTGRKAYTKAVYEAIYNLYIKEFNEQKEAAIKKHEEELKSKIGFYGNNLLIGAYNNLQESFPDAKFVPNNEYTFESLKEELTNEIEEGIINYNVVLAFDNTLSFSEEEYHELIELLPDNRIYVIKTDNTEVIPEGITIIDFASTIKDEYLLKDSNYLTETGNKALVELLVNTFYGNEEVEEDSQ